MIPPRKYEFFTKTNGNMSVSGCFFSCSAHNHELYCDDVMQRMFLFL